MKYLFIDFEFSNSYMNEPKICEFGYVLCDENFKILDDQDILINPGKGGTFQPSHRGVFHYYHPMNNYYKAKEYPAFYDEIKRLLTDKDILVFGYAVDGDINSVFVANKRYRKEQYEIVAYDVQRLLEEFIESNQKLSLENVFKDIYGDRDEYYDVVPHKPDDDAYMTMLILKEHTLILNQNVIDLINNNPQMEYHSVKGYGKLKCEKTRDN